MTDTNQDEITGWHAHVYYTESSKPNAEALREAMEARFPAATMGRWHDKPVGPHPMWSYQVAFEPALFGEIVPWLSLHHGDLTVLVHPLTGHLVREHTTNAMWMGTPQTLDVDMLRRAEEKRAKDAG